jgi:hypothetical protein
MRFYWSMETVLTLVFFCKVNERSHRILVYSMMGPCLMKRYKQMNAHFIGSKVTKLATMLTSDCN